ncbi:MAG: galactose oxidase [Alphaproteobacteria bacterium]|nr:galactose oxidase [Alphaproteobacteria bacterium]
MIKLTRRNFTAGALALSVTAPAFARQNTATWSSSAPLPIRIQEIYPTVLNGRIYVAGGFEARNSDSIDAVSDALFVSNPDFSGWTSLAPLPRPRHHPNLVGHDDAIYAVGGFRASEAGGWTMIANTTRYDPALDSWTEVSPLPRPYGETCAVSLDGLIHVATGRQPNGPANANWNDHGDRSEHYVYDALEDRWRRAAPNPTPRNSAAGAVLNGQFHVVGGRRVNAGNNAEHEAYDPQSDSWHRRAPLPQGQGGLAVAAAAGKLYAFGGEWFADGGGVYAQCWIYDPSRDAWEAGPNMASPRHGLGAVAVGGQIFAIGGALRVGGDDTSNLVEILTP